MLPLWKYGNLRLFRHTLVRLYPWRTPLASTLSHPPIVIHSSSTPILRHPPLPLPLPLPRPLPRPLPLPHPHPLHPSGLAMFNLSICMHIRSSSGQAMVRPYVTPHRNSNTCSNPHRLRPLTKVYHAHLPTCLHVHILYPMTEGKATPPFIPGLLVPSNPLDCNVD